MNRKTTLYIFITCLFLSGCAVTGTVKEKIDGRMQQVGEIKLDRRGSLKVETPSGLKMELDTREKNFWQSNVIPIFTGAINKADATVQP